MPVDGHPAGVTHERQDQEMRQGKLFWVAVLGKANHHIRVSLGRLILVGAQQPVPPGQVEPVIAVRLADDDRMVDPVHIGRYHEQPEYPVHFFREADVAVVEHGCGVQEHFENQHGQRRCAERGHGRQLDGHGYNDFDRMKPKPGGHIEVKVCVMHHVQPPKHRDGVMQDVLGINHEIQRHHADEDLKPIGQGQLIEQSPTFLRGEQGHPDG